jgi:hypothetical protein
VQTVPKIPLSALDVTIFEYTFANVTSIGRTYFTDLAKYTGETGESVVSMAATQVVINNQIQQTYANLNSTLSSAVASGLMLKTLQYYNGFLGGSAEMNNITELRYPVTSYQVSNGTGVPTNAPSVSPTVNPTTTPPYQVVPIIKSVNASASSSTVVSVTVSLTSSIDNPGTVSCNALSSSSPLVDTGILKISPFFATYTSVQSPVTFSITGLSPLKSVSIYCVVVTRYGYSSVLSDVQNTRADITTPCCYSVQFVTAPSDVYAYGYITRYQGSTANIFSYSLSNVPVSTISVVPFIFQDIEETVQVTSIQAVPKYLDFSSQAGGKLSGQFYLSSTSAELSGTFYVKLMVEGPGQDQYYDSVAVPVGIQADNQPDIPPTPSSCRFSDTGSFAILTFDRATNLAGISMSSWSCDRLLLIDGVSSATCSWVNSSSIKIVSSQLQLNGPVTVMGGLLKVSCTSNCDNEVLAGSKSLKITGPYNPLLPGIVFKAPSTVSIDSGLAIDATATTGSGGRNWKDLIWFVTDSEENDDVNGQLAEFLNNQTDISKRIVIPPRLLTSTIFTITLSATNFLDGVDSESFAVSVVDNPCLPTVLIKGSSVITTAVSSELAVVASASLPDGGSKCPGASLVYTWAVSKDGKLMDIKSSSASSLKFLAAKYAFKPLLTYTVTVTVRVDKTDSGNSAATASASVSVFVSQGALVAAIKGTLYFTAQHNSMCLLLAVL